MTKVSVKDRAAIRREAEYRGCKYRITRDGEVHFYGLMLDGMVTGWWLFAPSVELALRVIDGASYYD